MCLHRPARTLSAVTVAALLLLAAPVMAAPHPEAAPGAGNTQLHFDQILGGWWSELVGPLERVFGFSRASVDPNRTPTVTAATDTTGGTDHRATVDPDG